MVKLNKIYTKTGDQGTTGLGTGDRVAKHNARIAAYGTVDETNAAVGLARTELPTEWTDLDQQLMRIQNDLFDLGADLCVPDTGAELEFDPLRITDAQVARLEDELDVMNSKLEPLKSFILPAGHRAAAALHLARTVSRRAEREMTLLAADVSEVVSAPALKYINRLSDYLFVAARVANDYGKNDVLWVPGATRDSG
ncbi:MAG: cob(I)yrinic acid a,c-diamide adenosyltransferase [Alphaproteobacteria bacterium]|nr:cob(I)yrinic acid a,c-diamide adenosyltransferase [Alphaproteobacteria bacterium]